MNNLYNKSDAYKYLKNNKILLFLNIILFCILILIVFLITKFLFSKIIIVIDIILTCTYFIYLDISILFLRKQNIIKYQFLAKIDNLEHEELNCNIKKIGKEKVIKNIICNELELDNKRTVFLECNKVDINQILNKEIKIEVCDNFVIGWVEV